MSVGHTVATLDENGRHAVGLRLRLLEERLAPNLRGFGEVDPTLAAELDPSTERLMDLGLELERTRAGPTDATTVPSA